MGAKRNNLDTIELEVAAEYEKRRKRKKSFPGKTRLAKKVRAQVIKPPPVPGGKSLAEIKAMDPQDPAFRFTDQGKPRKWHHIDGSTKTEPENWKDEIRAYRQKKANDRRARARKWDAEVLVAQETLDVHESDTHRNELGIYDEDKLVAEQILDLDEWDNEELIRGYRRNRNGKFGVAPKYIPREIQQEAFRRLVARGDRTLKKAYLKSIEQLVELVQSADSEKVRLDAIKTLMERVVGKVADKVLVSHEEPWEGILADSIVPLSEAIPLELTPGDDGTYALEPLSVDEGEVETPRKSRAARGDPARVGAPSPSSSSKKNSKTKTAKSKAKVKK